MARIADVFLACDQAVANGVPLRPPDPGTSGSPFQNWFHDSLGYAGIKATSLGRNSWPDFVLVEELEGYELKGLEAPGRDRSFDANSRLPVGQHDGREIYYVFGRYPKAAAANKLGLSDLAIVHGSFLGRDDQLVHKNTSLKGAGSYGDVTIRVRKMFVPPTPFRSVTGTIGQRTLIVPKDIADGLSAEERLETAGSLHRVEAKEHVRRITIDLAEPGLSVDREVNPGGGTVHEFVAFRRAGVGGPALQLIEQAQELTVVIDDEDDEADV